MAPRLTKAKKEAIATFRSLTQTDEDVAIKCLNHVQYSSIENAIEHFYNHQDLYVAQSDDDQQEVQPAPVQQLQQVQQPVAQQQQVQQQQVSPPPAPKAQKRGGKKVAGPVKKSTRSGEAVKKSTRSGDAVKKLFEEYANDPADNLPDKIGPNGVVRLLNDLGLDAEDRRVLILAYKTGAEVMCEFSLAEWNKGMQDMQVDSVASLRRRLDEIDQGLKESDQFRPLYEFSFHYGLSAGRRNLDLDVALVYWKILYKDLFALLPLWVQFMTEVGKPVSNDTWNVLFAFANSIREDFSNYDEDDAWPSVFDEFVVWVRSKWAEEEQSSLLP